MGIKIALIIPHRNDRPVFLKHLEKMIAAQTLQPVYVNYVNYKPESDEKDITQRYRKGYSELSNTFGPVDLIAFIEVDDFYAPDYLETMAAEWLRAGKPDIIGNSTSIYYHLKLKKYFALNHPSRASAMNTLIKPGLVFPWCADNYEYTDAHLWKLANIKFTNPPILKGHLFVPDKIISFGIKHGSGLVGGRFHNDRLERYVNDDSDLSFLKQNCDAESFKFYSEFEV